MKIVLIVLSIIISLSSCASYEAMPEFRDEYERSITEYNNLLRSEEFEQAGRFVVDSLREEFDAKAKAAKNVQIIDHQISSVDSEILLKGAAIVTVQINYTIPPSSEVKTLVDSQKWSYVYVESEGRKRWRLMTLLPEFK